MPAYEKSHTICRGMHSRCVHLARSAHQVCQTAFSCNAPYPKHAHDAHTVHSRCTHFLECTSLPLCLTLSLRLSVSLYPSLPPYLYSSDSWSLCLWPVILRPSVSAQPCPFPLHHAGSHIHAQVVYIFSHRVPALCSFRRPATRSTSKRALACLKIDVLLQPIRHVVACLQIHLPNLTPTCQTCSSPHAHRHDVTSSPAQAVQCTSSCWLASIQRIQ